MSALLASAIQLAISVCGLINNAQTNGYVDQLKQAKMDLIDEDSKGDDADDGKIENLHKQIGVLIEAVNEQFALSQALHAPKSAAV